MNGVVIIFAGLAYRIAGSEWTGHDGELRGLRIAKLALRALPLVIVAFMLGCQFWVCALLWLFTGAADSLPHGQWQGATNAAQITMMTLVTLTTTVPCAAALFYYGDTRHAIAAMIFGSLGGPATWIGNKIPSNFSFGRIGFHHGPEIGEVARGLVRVLFIMV